MIIIFIFIFVFIIALLLLGIFQEEKLIQTFKDNDLFTEYTELRQYENPIHRFEILLINLDFLPSYRGEYCSILFENRFNLKLYSDFDILTLNTINFSYSIKLSKSASSIQNDIFAGKLLKIKIPGHNLLFKLPNEVQNIIYKNY